MSREWIILGNPFPTICAPFLCLPCPNSGHSLRCAASTAHGRRSPCGRSGAVCWMRRISADLLGAMFWLPFRLWRRCPTGLQGTHPGQEEGGLAVGQGRGNGDEPLDGEVIARPNPFLFFILTHLFDFG